MSMFPLAISCLTTSNLPWYMDLTFQVPMQYCSFQHQIFTTRHILNWVLFLLLLNLFLPCGATSPLFSSSVLDTYCPGEFIFQCHIFLPFSYCSWVLNQEGWSGLPFCFVVGHVLSELSTMTHLSWVALHSMARSFIELYKVVVHVISMVNFLWLCLTYTELFLNSFSWPWSFLL